MKGKHVLATVLLLSGIGIIVLSNPALAHNDECHGSSCDDVPGKECEHDGHEGNPHCRTEAPNATSTATLVEFTGTPSSTGTSVPSETVVDPTATPSETASPTVEPPSFTPTVETSATPTATEEHGNPAATATATLIRIIRTPTRTSTLPFLEQSPTATTPMVSSATPSGTPTAAGVALGSGCTIGCGPACPPAVEQSVVVDVSNIVTMGADPNQIDLIVIMGGLFVIGALFIILLVILAIWATHRDKEVWR